MSLSSIAADIAKCVACPLAKNRTLTVPGAGPQSSAIVIIGEAPGAKEDVSGLPFQGAAGRNLDAALEHINLSRSDVFITNTVKCRPPNNRDPTSAEKTACSDFLAQQLKVISPTVLVALGRHAYRSITGKTDFSDVVGTIVSFGEQSLFVSLHPAAIIYRRQWRDDYFSSWEKLADFLQLDDVKRGDDEHRVD